MGAQRGEDLGHRVAEHLPAQQALEHRRPQAPAVDVLEEHLEGEVGRVGLVAADDPVHAVTRDDARAERAQGIEAAPRAGAEAAREMLPGGAGLGGEHPA